RSGAFDRNGRGTSGWATGKTGLKVPYELEELTGSGCGRRTRRTERGSKSPLATCLPAIQARRDGRSASEAVLPLPGRGRRAVSPSCTGRPRRVPAVARGRTRFPRTGPPAALRRGGCRGARPAVAGPGGNGASAEGGGRFRVRGAAGAGGSEPGHGRILCHRRGACIQGRRRIVSAQQYRRVGRRGVGPLCRDAVHPGRRLARLPRRAGGAPGRLARGVPGGRVQLGGGDRGRLAPVGTRGRGPGLPVPRVLLGRALVAILGAHRAHRALPHPGRLLLRHHRLDADVPLFPRLLERVVGRARGHRGGRLGLAVQLCLGAREVRHAQPGRDIAGHADVPARQLARPGRFSRARQGAAGHCGGRPCTSWIPDPPFRPAPARPRTLRLPLPLLQAPLDRQPPLPLWRQRLHLPRGARHPLGRAGRPRRQPRGGRLRVAVDRAAVPVHGVRGRRGPGAASRRELADAGGHAGHPGGGAVERAEGGRGGVHGRERVPGL
ncbi:hypothetical protein DFJ74DRAFT_763346, partial [Hyaloraphidium curvatum]